MIIAIVQARMSSTRLPGKVLKKINDKSLLYYLINRIKKSKEVKDVVIATSDQADDDPIEDEAKLLNVSAYRGSRDDLLERYWKAFKEHEKYEFCDGIVRITADCPLVDPEIIDRVVSIFHNDGYDYVTTNNRVAEGLDVEVFRPNLLKMAYENAKLLSEREHLTQFFHNNSDKFKIYKFDTGEDCGRYRITVDEPEDFLVVSKIIDHFGDRTINTGFDEIRDFLDKNPNVFQLNSKIIRNEGLQKSLKNDKQIN